jgi:hypothetical protein
MAVHISRPGGNGGVASRLRFWDAPAWKWRYAEKLRATLLNDASHDYLARMICLPAIDKEGVVSVVRDDGHKRLLQGEPTYSVEYAVVAKQLWEEAEFQKVKVTRSRASLATINADRTRKVGHQRKMSSYRQETKGGLSLSCGDRRHKAPGVSSWS